MQPDRARVLVVSGLVVLSLALAAAILGGAVEAGPLEDFGLGNSPESQSPGEDTESGGFFAGTDAGRGAFGLFCLTHPLFVYGVPLFAALAIGGFFYRFGAWAGARLGAGFGLLVGVPYAALTACEAGTGGIVAAVTDGDQWAETGAVLPTVESNPAVLLALILGGMLLLAVALRQLRARGTLTASETRFRVVLPPRPANPGSELAGVADVAGEAAERIADDAAVDNEVYRAWREMTEHLDLDAPRASTPREFQEAAVAQGLDPERVAALTEVFERVRYGDADPETYAAEAVGALRAIEADAANASQD